MCFSISYKEYFYGFVLEKINKEILSFNEIKWVYLCIKKYMNKNNKKIRNKDIISRFIQEIDNTFNGWNLKYIELSSIKEKEIQKDRILIPQLTLILKDIQEFKSIFTTFLEKYNYELKEIII